jgi:hypothetical protein
MTATLSHADRVAAAKRADDQYLRRVTELCAQFKGATSNAQAARVGEELLRVHVHRYQEIRAWVRTEQRNDPAAAAEWLAPRSLHLMFVARAETYLLHALSTCLTTRPRVSQPLRLTSWRSARCWQRAPALMSGRPRSRRRFPSYDPKMRRITRLLPLIQNGDTLILRDPGFCVSDRNKPIGFLDEFT